MGKSINEERTKKIDENKQNRTFQNQLIRPEIAALDRFDFHLVTPFENDQFCHFQTELAGCNKIVGKTKSINE